MRRERSPAVAAALAGFAVIAALAGCSSGGGKAPSTTPSRTSARPPSGSPASSATTAAIQAAYTALFGTEATTAQSLAAVQHGAAFRHVVVAESKTSRAKGSGAKVTAVSLTSPDVAVVHFTVISNGVAVLPTVGKALRTSGHWQVAAATFCQLLTLNGDAPTQCHDPAFTALPH